MIILGNYFSSWNVSIIGPSLSSVSGHHDNDEVHTDCMHRNSLTNVMYFRERRLFWVYMSRFCGEVQKELIILPMSFSFWKESHLWIKLDGKLC